jgi:phage tail-like protein
VSEQSSYLRYLPPVLWQDDPAAPEFSLGSMLRIFEKLLTGIPDGVSVRHGDHEHPPLMTQIANLQQLFDPWLTPAAFLPWLASWVALEFPTLQGIALWDEYQQRKVTAQIAQIYRLRGRKAGLNLYLDLYAVGRTQPRVALDDGSRLLSVTPQAGQIAPVTALVSQGPVVTGTSVTAEGLTRPWCIAVDSGGDLLVGDIGLPSGLPFQLKSRVWHLGPSGNYDLTGAPPLPQPLASASLPLSSVVAVAVQPGAGTAAETLYVLDRPGTLYAIPAPFPGASATLVTSLATSGSTIWPVAMTVDPGNGDLLVLDRGGQPGNPSATEIITVQTTSSPPRVTRTPLSAVTEPLSLAVEPDGTLLIGDGGDQDPAGPAGFPGNLILVNRAAGTQTPQLPAANPLTAPTGIARTSDGRLFVLDTGVKPFAPSATDPFIGAVAQDAGIFQIDLTATPPTATRITEPGQFVYPTGMAASGGQLVVCDPGQPEVFGLQPYWSRVRPFQFSVVIHFADSRLPTDPASRQLVLAQAVGNIRTIIDDQKPAHTLWNLITAI